MCCGGLNGLIVIGLEARADPSSLPARVEFNRLSPLLTFVDRFPMALGPGPRRRHEEVCNCYLSLNVSQAYRSGL